MKTFFLFAVLGLSAFAADWRHVDNWPQLPGPGPELGTNLHGDIAVSSSGDIYVSTIDALGGLMIVSRDGKLVRKIPGTPNNFHGFVIRKDASGEFIYGPRLDGQSIVKLTLDGKVVMEIPVSRIPDQFKLKRPLTPLPPGAPAGTATGPQESYVRLTGMDVAPNGDLYVTDGYASSYVHRFDRSGKYLASFGGREPPYGFRTLHKIAIDPRFNPVRIVACDRENLRVVHLSLEGELLGVVATDLLRPPALAIHGDLLAVGELRGRVTILDKSGKIVAQLGANPNQDEIGTNLTVPAKWRPGILNAAHGVTFDPAGNLFVSEWSVFGRLHRWDKN
jgi:hypothetical protein